MAQMRLAIYVINRCGDVKAFAHSPLTVANGTVIGNCGFCADIKKGCSAKSVPPTGARTIAVHAGHEFSGP
jgi:hypothetical protein